MNTDPENREGEAPAEPRSGSGFLLIALDSTNRSGAKAEIASRITSLREPRSAT